MYKNRFKAWHWSKNTPTAWMTKKVQERKLAGKDTVFHCKDQRWTEEDLAQRHGGLGQDRSADGKFALLHFEKEPLLMLNRHVSALWPNP